MTKNDLINSSNYEDRIKAAEQGYGLDILIADEDEDVYNVVINYLNNNHYESVFDWAKNNNISINIKSWAYSDNVNKRYEVARAGYHLDILYDDEDSDVRDAAQNYLKKHNYKSISDWMNDNNINTSIDTLLYSKYHRDRCKVAKQGYRLDILVNDDDWQVRAEVAKQGYRLDILICDNDRNVYNAVLEYLNEHNYKSIFDWANDNGIEINLDEWL